MSTSIVMTAGNWLDLLQHFATLSLLAVGGAITTAPDMHRFLVDKMHWLSDGQFNASIALAQAAPGPNILFVALIGWHIGLNAGVGAGGGWSTPLWISLGVCLTMLGIMVPSSVLTYTATRWAHRHREHVGIRAFKAGMSPIVIALLLSTAWILATTPNQPSQHWPLYLTSLGATLLVWRTRVHMLWLILAGALLGGMGWL